MTALLQVEGLNSGYEPVQIVKDVTFSVEAGASIGFFGPNGHGKSTLLRTLSGVIDPWSGGIVFDGVRLNALGERKSRRSRHLNYDAFVRRRMDPAEVARAGLIQVPQGSTLFPELTVEETLSVAPTAARGTGRIADAGAILALFPRLAKRAKVKARHLSGGERQMLAMACGLLGAPRLLMLDEPTLGLSPKLRLEIADTVQAIRASGATILIVEQDIEFLRDLVDTLHIFDHGSISRTLSRDEIPDSETLIGEMFGRSR